MESENTVTYFLFNDRKSTLGCSFILICSLTFFELYSCFIYISPLLCPKYDTILFCLLPFSFSFHPYFIANPPPTRLHFQSFHPSFPSPFLFNSPPFPLVYLLLNPNQNSFSTPPPSLCNKGMATLSCNSYDIAPQKQCNYHLKALLLERKSYSFAPQRLYPQPTRA